MGYIGKEYVYTYHKVNECYKAPIPSGYKFIINEDDIASLRVKQNLPVPKIEGPTIVGKISQDHLQGLRKRDLEKINNNPKNKNKKQIPTTKNMDEHKQIIPDIIEAPTAPKNEFSESQKKAFDAYPENSLLLITGTAGSGKTHIAISIGLDMFDKKQIDLITFITPITDNDEVGFLKGTLKEKLAPRIISAKKIFYNLRRSSCRMEYELISHLRGSTFEKTLIIVDECQNMTLNQLKLCVGRIGVGSKIIFCGDHEQIDLKDRLESCIGTLKTMCIDLNGCTEIQLEGNKRHEIVPIALEYLSQF